MTRLIQWLRHTSPSVYAVGCLLVGFAGSARSDENRTALVVGCNYTGTPLQLPSPDADARALAATLEKQLGFQVELLPNPTRKQFLEAIDRFGESLAKRGGVGLFYFSGHGAQHLGDNYLIPAQATIGYREDLPAEAVTAERVVTRMEAAGNRVNLLFLDACRNNPLPSSKQKAVPASGFTGMSAANGMLIGFATARNTVANDSGQGSLYTNALLKHIMTPGLSVTDMLTRVNAEVRKVSGGTQIPFMEVGLSDVFAFLPQKPPEISKPIPPLDPVVAQVPRAEIFQPIIPLDPVAGTAPTSAALANQQLALGDSYVDKGEYANAAKAYTIAAEYGLALAQRQLALLYRHGDGVNADNAKAVAWMRKAADQGLADAEADLGYYYEHAVGLNKDVAKATELFVKSAEKGSSLGASRLAEAYTDGVGIAKNVKEAHRWYLVAANKGDAISQYNLALEYRWGNGVAKDIDQENYWLKKAAENGDPDAQSDLGAHYASGTGITKDLALSLSWTRKAADQGCAQAELNMGAKYYHGIGVPKNKAEAIRWWKKSVTHGNKEAREALKSVE